MFLHLSLFLFLVLLTSVLPWLVPARERAPRAGSNIISSHTPMGYRGPHASATQDCPLWRSSLSSHLPSSEESSTHFCLSACTILGPGGWGGEGAPGCQAQREGEREKKRPRDGERRTRARCEITPTGQPAAAQGAWGFHCCGQSWASYHHIIWIHPHPLAYVCAYGRMYCIVMGSEVVLFVMEHYVRVAFCLR